MKPTVSIREALADPELLGNALPGDTWRTWRIVLMAIMGEELTPDELETFQSLTGRQGSPQERVSEAAIIVGRRGGKSRALSVLGAYIGCLCEHPALVPGETGVVLLIAMDRDQAGIDLSYARAAIEESPILSRMLRATTGDALTLTNNIELVVRSPSFRRLRGRTAVAVLGDESAFWFTEDRSTNPDTEIVAAVKPMLATTGGPLLLASSAYAKRGVLYEAWKRDYGPAGDPSVLVAKGTSQQFNPSLPDHVIARALERDPEWARAEYLSEWRSDLESFVSRDLVERCVETDVIERPFVMGFTYTAFVDAAGGSGGDSYTLAISHRHGERVVIDAQREVKPPFSPADVTEDFCALLKTYRITSVRGDRYAGEWVAEAFRANGISFRPSERSKSEIYRDFLPLLNTQGVVLLDDPRCIGQLANLERRTRFGGRGESIDHPLKGHDDLANAVAGAAVHVRSGRAAAWDEDRKPLRAQLGYGKVKRAGIGRTVAPMMQPRQFSESDIANAPLAQPETYYVGSYGHKIVAVERNGDGRHKWQILDPAGQECGLVWGKDAAEAAVKQLMEEGTISRDR